MDGALLMLTLITLSAAIIVFLGWLGNRRERRDRERLP